MSDDTQIMTDDQTIDEIIERLR